MDYQDRVRAERHDEIDNGGSRCGNRRPLNLLNIANVADWFRAQIIVSRVIASSDPAHRPYRPIASHGNAFSLGVAVAVSIASSSPWPFSEARSAGHC